MVAETETESSRSVEAVRASGDHPTLKNLPLGVLISAVVGAGLGGGVGQTIGEFTNGAVGPERSAQIGNLIGAFLGAVAWNAALGLRARPRMKFVNLIIQVFVLIAAWLCASAITQWGGKKIGGDHGETFASLILLGFVFAAIFAFAGWNRMRQQKVK